MDFRLDGHTALVSGASRGLGAAIAEALHSLGAIVVGTSRVRADAERLAARYGTPSVVLDVDDPDGAASTIGDLIDQGVVPDLLVNNAGVNAPQPALDVDRESWDRVYASNVRGTFFVTQALARHWVRLGVRGSVVTVGSQAGRVAIADRAAYGSSKAAIEQLTRNLAYEWAPHGIRVNAVAPTFVLTDLTRSTLDDPDRGAALLARIPLGRFGETGDIAGPVAFLLGPQASLITGHTLVIDGGFTIH
jgi:NAD(P)-dependent dehydrogenase (short-subunit alcohol dehydrogenase family)